MQKRQITDKATRQHFINRAQNFAKYNIPEERILKIIEKELEQKPAAMAAVPWTGFSRK